MVPRPANIALALSAGTLAAIAAVQSASAYTVMPGDTLWGIARNSGSDIRTVAAENHLANPDLIYPGQNIVLPGLQTAPAPHAGNPPAETPDRVDRSEAQALLTQAAMDQGIRPAFVLAVSYWESGWNQSLVSSTGAVGMMQIEPDTAAWAGPALLHRRVDIHNPRDNAQLGAALLRRYLDRFDDPKLALAAYYQGESAVQKYGIYPSSRAYVNGIWALRNRFQAST